MSGFLSKLRNIPRKYPLVRGMAAYAVIWPACSITQEYLERGAKTRDFDWARATRFGIFGTFFMAPVFYSWIKFSNRFFKTKNLKTAVLRACLEQITYSPVAVSYFFFGMSLLEMKPIEKCVEEVQDKFWATYKIGVIYWPTVQTLNFYFISERNRMIFVSLASFIWTVYLAHIKSKEQRKLNNASM